MNIHLKNIGIVKDSSIEIKGLTVITGQNNSGKTTVGKALYSLIDSVVNLKQKALNDRYYYAIEQMEKACEVFPFYLAMRRGRRRIENECLNIFFSDAYEEAVVPNKIDMYLVDLIHELENLDIREEPYENILSIYYKHSYTARKIDYKSFCAYRDEAISILLTAKENITSDPELIHYAKQSIHATLMLEFYGQIQPVNMDGGNSLIEIYNHGEPCFKINIEDNEISDEEEVVYWNTPYRKVHFIDNPYILNEPVYGRANKYLDRNLSFVNEARIISHDNKLKYTLDSPRDMSIFEGGIIDGRYKVIKEKIDLILPGEFEAKDGDRFYVDGSMKLNSGNLATGSKLFSIIKILLELGEIDETTLLILDEPESHLHPEWQNSFVEILMLLIKEIGCHVLLTTHSSHFMLAIDAYMRKYEITDICNFYHTEHIDNGAYVTYQCVNDSLDTIYRNFVSFLSDVKLLRNEYLSEGAEE